VSIPPPAKVSWKPSRKALAGFLTAGLAAAVSLTGLSAAHLLTLTSGLLAAMGPMVPAVTFYLVPPPG
jgi:VIT1/CCC1 family predicted Fe2+/Mn2+ transporter